VVAAYRTSDGATYRCSGSPSRTAPPGNARGASSPLRTARNIRYRKPRQSPKGTHHYHARERGGTTGAHSQLHHSTRSVYDRMCAAHRARSPKRPLVHNRRRYAHRRSSSGICPDH
jgi:hypothetical protein